MVTNESYNKSVSKGAKYPESPLVKALRDYFTKNSPEFLPTSEDLEFNTVPHVKKPVYRDAGF